MYLISKHPATMSSLTDGQHLFGLRGINQCSTNAQWVTSLLSLHMSACSPLDDSCQDSTDRSLWRRTMRMNQELSTWNLGRYKVHCHQCVSAHQMSERQRQARPRSKTALWCHVHSYTSPTLAMWNILTSPCLPATNRLLWFRIHLQFGSARFAENLGMDCGWYTALGARRPWKFVSHLFLNSHLFIFDFFLCNEWIISHCRPSEEHGHGIECAEAHKYNNRIYRRWILQSKRVELQQHIYTFELIRKFWRIFRWQVISEIRLFFWLLDLVEINMLKNLECFRPWSARRGQEVVSPCSSPPSHPPLGVQPATHIVQRAPEGRGMIRTSDHSRSLGHG